MSTSAAEAPPISRTLAGAAPMVFVGLWSTGFVVARYATTDADPLMFLSVRLAIAAAVLAAIAAASGAPRPDRGGLGWSMVAGLGIHATYLGGVFVAIDLGLPSGVSALIGGLHPVVTALAGGPLLGERLSKHQWFGVGLGFAGVVAVVADQFGGSSTAIPVLAVIVGFTATIGMSTGSLIQRRRCSGVPMLWGTVSQYAASATVLVTIAVAGRRTTIEFTATTIWSLVWSVGVLSIVAVLTMLWLLRHRAAASVSSLFFLFPALSAIEGAVLFGERLG
ncbi:MAG: EamA family transporter, partial [Actinomycetota bacterium]|nr:EamA family transporter [Actinomycetota bacterium]